MTENTVGSPRDKDGVRPESVYDPDTGTYKPIHGTNYSVGITHLPCTTLTATVASGDTTSSAIDISDFGLLGLYIPALGTNAAIYLQVAESLAGTFKRLYLSDLSGYWTVPSATEDLWLFVPDLAPFGAVKVEVGSAQSTDTVFLLVGRS